MADLALFAVEPGETVTAFELGPLEESYFPGEVTCGVSNVDYQFVNGFVDVGDLPCRKAVWADIASREQPAFEAFETVTLNLPGFNRRLDFSGFWHIPHRLKRWCRTRLFPQQSGAAPFRIATCGGVHIWVDGAHIAAFEPYRRNATQEKEITLPLKAEGSDVVILLEDMAERDTNFFLEMTWEGPGVLRAGLPTSADPEALSTLMDLARSVHPARVVFDGTGPLELSFDAAAPGDVAVSATVGQSVHLSHKPPLFAAEAVLKKGARKLSLDLPEGLPDAYHPLRLVFAIGEMRVERAIAFALLREGRAQALPGTLDDRKAQAMAYAAQHGELRTGRLLAQLETGKPLDAAAMEILQDTLDGIRQRRDCSDFVMVPLLWVYGAHREDLPEEIAAEIKAAVLNYRYWMDEPGNDTMWFWSENHVLCFHVSEYIAGGLFPEEVFPNSGLTGAEHRALAEARLTKWYESVEAHGLAEWNSAAYYPVDFIGLLAMQHWGEGAMKRRAEGVLDRLFTMIALHTCNGVSAGTMGRAYDKELRAGPLSELAPFAAVGFGRGWLNEGVAALPMFCASDYAPPEHLARFAAPDEGTAIEARYVQGFGEAARLALYKTAHVQISAAVDAGGGRTGHQQHLVDVQAAADPFARIWVNHPGEDDPWGMMRPSYWAGNGIMPQVGMHANCCLILSDLGEAPRLPFTHAYAPLTQFDEVLEGEDWRVFRSGRGFVLLKATGPVATLTRGPGAGLEHRCEGVRTGWAIVAGDLDEAGLVPVAERAAAMRLTIGEEPLTLRLSEEGQEELLLDYASGLSVAGQPVPFPTHSPIPQVSEPIPSLTGGRQEKTQ